jgi:hypothetical protein
LHRLDLPGTRLAISCRAVLGQESGSASVDESLSSSAPQNYRIMAWPLERDDNTLIAVESEHTCVDRQHGISRLALNTVQIPGPGRDGKRATTLKRSQHGTFGQYSAIRRIITERLDQGLDGCVTAPALQSERSLAYSRQETRWLQPLGNLVRKSEPVQARASQDNSIKLP